MHFALASKSVFGLTSCVHGLLQVVQPGNEVMCAQIITLGKPGLNRERLGPGNRRATASHGTVVNSTADGSTASFLLEQLL